MILLNLDLFALVIMPPARSRTHAYVKHSLDNHSRLPNRSAVSSDSCGQHLMRASSPQLILSTVHVRPVTLTRRVEDLVLDLSMEANGNLG